MTCIHYRCWRSADVYIPGVGEWCSGHVFDALGTWPMRHLRELETQIKDSRRTQGLIRGRTAA